MNNVIKLAKLSSGCTLRKTTNKEQTKRRYYASIESLGCVRFVRISRDVYDTLNTMARNKCAFTTNIISDDKIQYSHCIAL